MVHEPATVFDSETRIRPLLHSCQSVSLEEIGGVALMDRRDTKYVLGEDQLAIALAAVADRYRVLEINAVRLQRYRTVYFDSPDLDLYRAHHNRRPNRYKVRSRLYIDTGAAFLEVKRKAGCGRTVKERTPTPGIATSISEGERAFLAAQAAMPSEPLRAQLSNEFLRATLVNREMSERVTIDLGISLASGGRRTDLNGVVVAEVKEAGHGHRSEFARQMREMSLRPSGFSKYCVGVALLRSDVKHNTFKPELRLIEAIIMGETNVC